MPRRSRKTNLLIAVAAVCLLGLVFRSLPKGCGRSSTPRPAKPEAVAPPAPPQAPSKEVPPSKPPDEQALLGEYPLEKCPIKGFSSSSKARVRQLWQQGDPQRKPAGEYPVAAAVLRLADDAHLIRTDFDQVTIKIPIWKMDKGSTIHRRGKPVTLYRFWYRDGWPFLPMNMIAIQLVGMRDGKETVIFKGQMPLPLEVEFK